jgi:signal transduction histidine kinase
VIVTVGGDGSIAISDHGDGIAPSEREMIFEPFWRKGSASAGSGLGLAIAKELMQVHGGRIWVEETAGGGATFRLSFPRTNLV